MAISKRSIGVSILLSIITLGIYGIYWQYLLVKNVRATRHDTESCTGEMLCLIFVPFYSLYWWFTRGETVRQEFTKRSHNVSSNGTVFIVLSLFGLSIVSMAIMQNDFNSLPSTTQPIQRSAEKEMEQKVLLADLLLQIKIAMSKTPHFQCPCGLSGMANPKYHYKIYRNDHLDVI